MAIRDVLKRNVASLLKLVDRVDELERQIAAGNTEKHAIEIDVKAERNLRVHVEEELAAAQKDLTECKDENEKILRANHSFEDANDDLKERLSIASAKIHDQDEAFEAAKAGVSHLEAMYSKLEAENGQIKKELAEYKKAMTRHISVPKSWVDEAIEQMDSEGEHDGEEGKPR